MNTFSRRCCFVLKLASRERLWQTFSLSFRISPFLDSSTQSKLQIRHTTYSIEHSIADSNFKIPILPLQNVPFHTFTFSLFGEHYMELSTQPTIESVRLTIDLPANRTRWWNYWVCENVLTHSTRRASFWIFWMTSLVLITWILRHYHFGSLHNSFPAIY